MNKRVNDKSELDSFLSSAVEKGYPDEERHSSVNEFISSEDELSGSYVSRKNIENFTDENSKTNANLPYSSLENNHNEHTDEFLNLKEELKQLKELVNEISIKDTDQRS